MSIGSSGYASPRDYTLAELSFDALQEKAGELAERKLIIAVLEDAIVCYQRYLFAVSGEDKRVFDQAEAWLMRDSGKANRAPFSFDYICDALGLDKLALRQQLRLWCSKQIDSRDPYVSSRQRCRWRAVHRESVTTADQAG